MAKTNKKTEQPVIYFWLKVVCFTLLLLASAFYFGTSLQQLSQIHDFPLPPFKEYLSWFVPFLISFSLLLLFSGLVAALIRPIWLPMIAFALAALALLLGWGISETAAMLVGSYLLICLLYTYSLKKGIQIRIRFVPTLAIRKQKLLALMLILLTSSSLFLGYTDFLKTREVTPADLEQTRFIHEAAAEYIIPKDLPAKQKEQKKKDFIGGTKEIFDQGANATLVAAKTYLPITLATLLFSILFLVAIVLIFLLYFVFFILFKLLQLSKVLWIEY